MQFLPHPGQDLLPDHGDESIQILPGGIAANRDAERAVDDFGIDLHGIQHMAPVALGAGTAGGYADAVILKNIDGILGGYPGNSDV